MADDRAVRGRAVALADRVRAENGLAAAVAQLETISPQGRRIDA